MQSARLISTQAKMFNGKVQDHANTCSFALQIKAKATFNTADFYHSTITAVV